MAKKLELSWVGTLKQWRKRRKVGDKTKTFYLGTGNGKGDMVGYQKARAKWRAIEAGLDATDAQTEAVELTEKFRKSFAHLPPYVASTVISDPIDSNLADAHYRSLEHNYIAASSGKVDAKVKPLSELVDDYVAVQRRRYEHGLKFPNAPQDDRISPARFVGYKNIAKHMRRVWADTPLPRTEAETFGVMKQYRDWVQDRLTAGTYKPGTFNEHIKTLGHLFRWLFKTYQLVALPRNFETLTSRYATKTSARALDLPVVRQIWEAADDRMKCWIALACNCGLYSSEISHLTSEMVEGNYLFWTRHKTNVPIRFKLWKVTKMLLARTAENKGYLFTDANGEQVNVIDVEKGSRKSKIDNQLTIIKRELKIKKVSFGNFRDTSSTKIESIDPTLTDLFDAHADQRMARWYVDHSRLDQNERFAAFDKAVDALGKWYGLKLAE